MHEFELNKIQSSELRHSQNVLDVKQKFEQRANDMLHFIGIVENKKNNKKINFYILKKNMKKNLIDWKKLKKKRKKIEKI